MNNSQSNQETNQAITTDRRLPYQTPQLIQVMMLEESSVLGGCKGMNAPGSAGPKGCNPGGGGICMSINNSAS